MKRILFIQEPYNGTSQRSKELERSKAAAHAASVSYQRRRRRQETTRRTSAVSGSLNFTCPVSITGKNSAAVVSENAITIISAPSEADETSESDALSHKGSFPNGHHLSAFTGSATNVIPRDTLGLRSDPFNCIQGSRTHNVAMVIDYHANIMAPNHAPIYKIFNVTSVYTTYYFELLSKEAFLHAGVASVQAVIDKFRQPGRGPSHATLQHLGKAIASLRKTLDNINNKERDVDDMVSLDDTTIILMLYLAACTIAIGDMVAHDSHKRSLAAVVAARGGIDKLIDYNGMARCNILQWESFWALNTGGSVFSSSRPPYKPEYAPFPMSETLLRQVATLPTGFQSLAQSRRLAIDVIEVLARTAAAQIEYDLNGTIVNSSDVFGQKPRRFSDFWEACTCFNAPDEILFVRSDNSEASNVSMPNLQKLVILGLVLYCLNTFSPSRAVTAIYNGSRMKLTTDVPREFAVTKQYRYCSKEHDESDTERSVLLWVAFVLVDSWRALNETLLPQGIHLLRETKNHFAEYSSWIEIEHTLQLFFWNEAFLSRCRGFWLLFE